MDSTLSGLPEITVPSGDDLLYLVTSDANSRKVKASNLVSAFPIATDASKGLMSASDKGLLDQVIIDVALLKSPLVQTIVAATAIIVPANVFNVVLTGTTEITAIAGLVNYRTYTFFYPSGAGVTIMGQPMLAGDVYQFVQTP